MDLTQRPVGFWGRSPLLESSSKGLSNMVAVLTATCYPGLQIRQKRRRELRYAALNPAVKLADMIEAARKQYVSR